MLDLEILHFQLFCGLGGAGIGLNRSRGQVGGFRGTTRCLGGVDVNRSRIRDFERLVGVPGTVLDLFSREGYALFHGHPPPADWREATPDDLRQAAGGERPHIIYSSPPCTGFSGLVTEKRSKGARYRALNELTLRGIFLALTAWEDDPVEFFVIENVPRIRTRGVDYLDAIKAMLDAHGYSWAETDVCLGRLGGLGQRRLRYHLVARHREKVPPMLYQPEERPLRSVGEVIGGFPIPGTLEADACGAMHSLPRLEWRTWVRLALIKAGHDWRYLKELEVEDGIVQGLSIVPAAAYHHGALGVLPWDEEAGAVTGGAAAQTGKFSVQDPRPRMSGDYGQYGVVPWEDTAGTVTSKSEPGSGRYTVQDPRVRHPWKCMYGVLDFEEPAGAVTGGASTTRGAYSVSDPRLAWKPTAHRNKLRVTDFDQPAGTVTGADRVGSGAPSIADPRPIGARGGKGKYRVTRWDEQSGAVIAASSTGQGAFAIQDPRLEGRRAFCNVFRVVDWREASQAVTAGGGPTAGGQAIADPRPTIDDRWLGGGPYGVLPWNDPAGAVAGKARHDNSRVNVQDPRLPEASDRLEAVIIALDGCWHRPLTTLELAALQGLVSPGEVLELEGKSHTAWREGIGNAVPPPAAEVVGSVICQALLAAWSGVYLQAALTEPWCQPYVIAVSLDR